MMAQVLRGKGPYPVAEYRLSAEISAAAAAQAAAVPSGQLADDWYQPLLASGPGSDAGAGGREAGTSAASASNGGSARGVYSFCMCPGGQIVPTSTHEGELCINGMSFSRCVVWSFAAPACAVGALCLHACLLWGCRRFVLTAVLGSGAVIPPLPPTAGVILSGQTALWWSLCSPATGSICRRRTARWRAWRCSRRCVGSLRAGDSDAEEVLSEGIRPL